MGFDHHLRLTIPGATANAGLDIVKLALVVAAVQGHLQPRRTHS